MQEKVKRNERKVKSGIVISNKMQKTVVVQVNTLKKHKKYEKTIRVSEKYHVHDEKQECGLNDRVMIVETRPLSKTKRWRLLEVVEKAQAK